MQLHIGADQRQKLGWQRSFDLTVARRAGERAGEAHSRELSGNGLTTDVVGLERIDDRIRHLRGELPPGSRMLQPNLTQ